MFIVIAALVVVAGFYLFFSLGGIEKNLPIKTASQFDTVVRFQLQLETLTTRIRSYSGQELEDDELRFAVNRIREGSEGITSEFKDGVPDDLAALVRETLRLIADIDAIPGALGPTDIILLGNRADILRQDFRNFTNANNARIIRTLETEAKALAKARLLDLILIFVVLTAILMIFLFLKSERKLMVKIKAGEKAALASAQAKAEFLANMSHEIRTPLNAVVGFGSLALQTDLPPKAREYIEKTGFAAQTLLRIINDILDFSKIEAGHLSMENTSFDLRETIDAVMTLLPPESARPDVDLLMYLADNLPERVRGDPYRITQVLVNLLSNALKFTDKGWIALKVVPVGMEDGKVLISLTVEDTGIGMTEEQIGRIFQPFEQADRSMTRRYGGTGLGLAISLRLVEIMGSTLEVTSKPSVGSSFSFTLALEVEEVPETRAEPSLEKLDGLTVLIVDDNAEAREILTEDLKNHAGEILTAASGAEALDLYRQRQQGKGIDIVLMDWKMPGLDGIETMKRMFGLSGNEKPPVVIMMSAYDYDTVTDRAIEAGAHTFLRKPFTAETLKKSLASALRESAEASAVELSSLAPRGERPVTRISGALVLVVEDNSTNAEIVGLMLANCGAKTISVADADHVWPALAEHRFDAVLLDLQLPGTDGYAIAREIRKRMPGLRLPVIALTADVLEGVRERCIEAGMDDFLAKPIDQETLQRVLEKWIPPRNVDTGATYGQDIIENRSAGRDKGLSAELWESGIKELENLRVLVEANDFRALSEAERLIGSSVHAGMKEVKNSIARFDFGTALQKLNNIIKERERGKR